MEKTCKDSVVSEDRKYRDNKMNESTFERNSKCLSPVFGTSVKNVRCIPGPDGDIPSYQIPRSCNRFSDILEEQDSILPISPVSTPPSISKFGDFKEPLIHTIGTLVKSKGDEKIILNEDELDVELKSVTRQYPSIFDKLGMLDNDISWNSSMETPAPHPLSLNDYNTIERAILLPENDMKSMQPRALFSPCKDDDVDCAPLRYSSESDDEGDHLNGVHIPKVPENFSEKTKVEECKNDETLMGSPKPNLISDINTGGNIENKKEIIMSPSSPVFKIKKYKKRSKANKMRVMLVKSPVLECFLDANEDENKINCDSNSSQALTENKLNSHKENSRCDSLFSEQSNSIQDDSFQDMSFSCIDELCKSSAGFSDCGTNMNSSLLDGENVQENEKSKVPKLSVAKGKLNQNKFFYEDTKKSDELKPVPFADGFLKSAKRLEEANSEPEKKVNPSFTNRELTVFNKMIKEVPNCALSGVGVKRIRSENSPEKSPTIFRESKVIKLDNDRECEVLVVEESIETASDDFHDVNSHFDANDSQMCLTAAYVESLVNNSDFTSKNFSNVVNQGVNKEMESVLNTVNEVRYDHDFINHNSNAEHQFSLFSTALGNSISIAGDAFKKVRNIFQEDYDDSDIIKSEMSNIHETEKNEKRDFTGNFEGFKTASGIVVKIDEKSLSKARNLFPEITEDLPETAVVENIGFATASGQTVKVTEESLNKARNILKSVDMKRGPETAKENMEKVRDEPNRESTVSRSIGFRTASNRKIDISKDSLRKVQTMWKGEEEIREVCFDDPEDQKSVVPENESASSRAAYETCERPVANSAQKFHGFSTASGKNISVSNNALTKAKKILGDIKEVSTDEIVPFSVRDNGDSAKELKTILPDKMEESHTIADDKDEDSEELIPDWLHAYNTSPTLIMERSHLTAMISHEECQRHSTPREEYIVKSPILGMTDRFYNKRKRRNPGRKLIFEPSPKLRIKKDSYFRPNFNLSYKDPEKRNAAEMNIHFGISFKRRKLNIEMNDFPSEEIGKLSEETKEGRRRARLEQVKAGKKGKVKPVKGSHLLKKDETQMSWQEAVQGGFPKRYSEETLLKHGVREDVLSVTSSTAVDYRFKSTDFFTSADSLNNVNGFQVGDGCLLIFDDENKAGVVEFARAFFASPGVESNLISIEWIKNHYKWIVWKFTHYERAFPHIFGGKCLTPHNVLVQLKYRYDREIDRSHRSALKKILERDDSSARKVVFCVSDIRKTSDLDSKLQDISLNKSLMSYKLELTDGWYSCSARTDSAMTTLIEQGKVLIGTKLVTHGAELLNCDKGISPLEAGENIHLKISTNSTRRARWDVKLGFQKNGGGSLLVSLNSILPNGGLVSRIDVIIARIYPRLYMEKNSDGTHVTRNSRMEDKAAAAYQQQQEAAIEKIYQRVKDEFRNKEKEKKTLVGKFSLSDILDVEDAEELNKFCENCSDPFLFQSHMTKRQKEVLHDYQRRKREISDKELANVVQEKIKAEKMNSRKVSELLKMKIVDLRNPNYERPALFTVWNSSEDVSRIFSEGKTISIFNTTPGNSRFFNSVQLNSTRQTRYKELSQSVVYPARKITNLNELTSDCEHIFNEVDIVGVVVATHETSFGSRLSQTIYVADQDFNFAGIVFWGNCKDYGWENILTVNSIVACSNLQWSKRKNSSNIPHVYVNDASVFTENPKKNYLKEEIERLKTCLPEDKKSFVSRCAKEINSTLEESKQHCNLSKNTSIPNDSSLNSSSNPKPKYFNGFKTKPNASSTPFKSVYVGLDTSEQEPSPIQKRIEKLQMYGEPPPLSPLLPLDNLEKFKTKFRVPFKNSPAPDSASK